ncbi:MAG: cbb3-type cytochrome c oxidase subunit 3 [Pseudomonadota bacterium]
MELYTLLRAFADSWFLLAMTTFYVGVFFWVIRPGSNRVHEEIKQIPLRDEHDDEPDLIIDPKTPGVQQWPTSQTPKTTRSKRRATNGTGLKNSTIPCRAGGSGRFI